MSNTAIYELATGLTSKHETNNPFKIAEEMGIIILFEELGSINGYYNKFLNTRFIHINNNLSDTKQRLVCAHELGHAIIHENENSLLMQTNNNHLISKFEREANLFSASLLLSPYIYWDEDYKPNDSELYDTLIDYYNVMHGSDLNINF